MNKTISAESFEKALIHKGKVYCVIENDSRVYETKIKDAQLGIPFEWVETKEDSGKEFIVKNGKILEFERNKKKIIHELFQEVYKNFSNNFYTCQKGSLLYTMVSTLIQEKTKSVSNLLNEEELKRLKEKIKSSKKIKIIEYTYGTENRIEFQLGRKEPEIFIFSEEKEKNNFIKDAEKTEENFEDLVLKTIMSKEEERYFAVQLVDGNEILVKVDKIVTEYEVFQYIKEREKELLTKYGHTLDSIEDFISIDKKTFEKKKGKLK